METNSASPSATASPSCPPTPRSSATSTRPSATATSESPSRSVPPRRSTRSKPCPRPPLPPRWCSPARRPSPTRTPRPWLHLSPVHSSRGPASGATPPPSRATRSPASPSLLPSQSARAANRRSATKRSWMRYFPRPKRCAMRVRMPCPHQPPSIPRSLPQKRRQRLEGAPVPSGPRILAAGTQHRTPRPRRHHVPALP